MKLLLFMDRIRKLQLIGISGYVCAFGLAALLFGICLVASSSDWSVIIDFNLYGEGLGELVSLFLFLVIFAAMVIAILAIGRRRPRRYPRVLGTCAQTKLIERTSQIVHICPSCGKLNDNLRFCGHCGKRLG
jgi:hypothetical protein